MRILILNPPFKPRFSRTSRSPAVSKGGCVYYPIWLAYATGVLQEAGHKVKLVDAPAENKALDEIVGIAKAFRPKMIVLDTSTASIHNDIMVAEALKKQAKCFVVLVGTHVSAMPEWALKQSKAVDAVCIKEYDYTLRDLAKELSKKKPALGKVKGIAWRKGSRIKVNELRPLIENLDELPFVSKIYKEFLEQKNYFYPANLFPEITIVSGRGCPYRCTFCLLPQTLFSRAYRTRSIPNVIAEIKYILKEFPETKEIFFEDDTFTANRHRVKEFCDAVQKEGLKFTWSANARADVDFETLKAMKEAGCRLLCVGIESGEQKILNDIHKGTLVEGIARFMNDAKRAGILVHGCFILGNQGETKETIRKTIDFAKRLDPDTAQFFPIMVYPGTEAFDYFREKGFLTTTDFSQWVNEEGSHNTIVSRPGLSSEELVGFCDLGRREFYIRPKYIGKKLFQGLTSPREIPRLAKASGTLFKYLVRGTKKEKKKAKK
ncbi:MAG: radical SAM protein [Candidatus Diapherotrites archaeon]|nr:radical SAM protein [Candidatus Diapherotrites archaeon]